MKALSETPRTDAQSQLDAKRYHGHSRDYVSLKIFTAQLERELNKARQEFQKDKERLDWLEKSDYELYEPNTDALFSESSRAAIDEAMQRDSSPFGCKCVTLSQKVLGDGCDICNPELAKELEEESSWLG